MAFQNDRITSIPAPLPKDYDPTFSFEDWQETNPQEPLPGLQLDQEFQAVEEALDETQARLRLIQREDGALENESVGLDQIKPGLQDELVLQADSSALAAAASAVESGEFAEASQASATESSESADAAAESVQEAENIRLATDQIKDDTQEILNTFQDQYWGAFETEPTESPIGNLPDEGDLYFNTTDSAMYVYGEGEWKLVTTTVEGVYEVTELTDVAGQSTFTLDYDVGLLQVLYNGVQLSQGDFTATDGTSIVLGEAVQNAEDTITFIRWGAVTESSFVGTAATMDNQTGDTVLRTAAAQDVGTGPGELLDSDTGYWPGNILGTVSTSGGIPTGAIIERGSNDDGEYVKFADGTMQCWLNRTTSNGTGGVTDTEDWFFPEPFSTNPVCDVGFQAREGDIDASVNNAIGLRTQNQTSRTTKFTYFYVSETTGLAIGRSLRAFGRWY